MHGLVERLPRLDALAVLDLGVQNSPPGALQAALSARLAEPLPPSADLTADGALTLAWTLRGAPHLHRTADLPVLAAAGWPRDDADAGARLGWQRKRLAEVDGAARWAFRAVADAVRAVLTQPMTKAELSRAVTDVVPTVLSPFCRPCGVHHVGEQLLRVAALPGGARLVPGSRPLTFEAIPQWPGPPADDAACTTPVQAAYLRFFAPATDADIAGFLGTTRAATAPDRPAAVPVTVEGRTGMVAEDDVAALRAARSRGVVRLLPPSDPYLQGRDREAARARSGAPQADLDVDRGAGRGRVGRRRRRGVAAHPEGATPGGRGHPVPPVERRRAGGGGGRSGTAGGRAWCLRGRR